MTVTFTPKSASIDAHSTPIAPPPAIRIDAGSSSISSASSDVITYSPSTANPGRTRGREPVAMIKFFGRSISLSAPAPSIETVPATGEKMEGPRILPVPSYTSIFPFFIKDWTPRCNCATTAFFRSRIFAKFKAASRTSTPKSALFRTSRYTSALLNRVFVGMQPLWRQVPPSFDFSTIAVFSPFFAARMAAT